jgi:hypothetical protein
MTYHTSRSSDGPCGSTSWTSSRCAIIDWMSRPFPCQSPLLPPAPAPETHNGRVAPCSRSLCEAPCQGYE